jgi:uncharacterized membrane protein YgcG
MRRNLVLLAVLFFASLSALGQSRLGQSRQSGRFANPLLDDIVQMSRAELPEQTILAFVRARQARLETDVSADDLIRLHRAGVSDRVVAYIASVSGLENRRADRDRDSGMSYDLDSSSAAPDDSRDGDGDVAVDPEPYGPVDGGWWGWGGYPYWYDYSPFFYGGVVIRGGGRFHHRDHGHDGGGHGDHGHASPRGSSRGSSGGHQGGGSHGGGSHGGGSHGGGGHR